MPIAQFATTRLGTPQYTHTVPVADAKASAMSRSSLDMGPNNYSPRQRRRCTKYATPAASSPVGYSLSIQHVGIRSGRRTRMEVRRYRALLPVLLVTPAIARV